MIIFGREITVPLSEVRDPYSVVRELTFENGSWNGSKNAPKFFALARIEDDNLILPRAYDVEKCLFDKRAEREVEKDPSEWETVWLGDNSPRLGPHELMPYDQGPAWEALSSPCERPWGRVLALKCGAGKTISALKLAHLRSKRTLVICHTLNMCQTWSTAAAAEWCLDYPKENHGLIGGGTIDWETRDLCFATMQGVLCRDYPQEFWDRWGLVIFDEGDLLGAGYLQQMLPKFLGERVLVTATPKRTDGNDVLYKYHVGPICFSDTEQDLKPKCFVLDSPVPSRMEQPEKKGSKKLALKSTEKKAWNSYAGKVTASVSRTVSFLDTLIERRNWCIDIVEELLAEGRKILFLGERIESLRWFDDQAKGIWPQYKSGLALGAQHTSNDEVEHVLKTCDVIWGIQQIAKRGLNQPDLDTVIVQYSCFNDSGRLQQTVGRVLRHVANKKEPFFILLNDVNVPCLNRNAERIASWVRGKKYELEWLEYTD